MKKLILFSTTVMGSFVFIAFNTTNRFQGDVDFSNVEVKELPYVTNAAFQRGEQLTFRLHYGIIDAAKATLSITDEETEYAGRKTYHVVGLGSSQGISDWFFKVRDRYESYIDEKALVPWVFIRRIDEGGFKASQDYFFNHYSKKVKTGKDKTYDITPNIQDMISAFYRARNLDLSKANAGDVYSLDCFVDEEIYPVKIKFVGRETIKTDLGKFRCLKFRPLVQTGRIFKHEEDLNIWISDDKNHIPVKAKADILFGSVQIELTDYKGLVNPVSKVTR